MSENHGFRIIDTLPYITLQDQKMFHCCAEISYNNNPSRCSPRDSSSEMDCTEAEIEKKRGVKRGSQRGPYSKTAKNDTKLRIIAAAEKD